MIKRSFSLTFWIAVVSYALLVLQPASAQLTLPGGGTYELFGPPGLSTETDVTLTATGGPFNAITGLFSLPGGGELDWHVNPGVAVISVTAGLINEYHSNGCVTLHEAGDVFFELEGQVHRIENPSATEPVEALITFVAPVGSELVTFAPAPQQTSCDPSEDPHGQEQPSDDLAEIKAAIDSNANTIAEIQSLLVRVARTLSLNP